MNIREMLLIALMVALVAGLILLSGCTAQEQGQAPPGDADAQPTQESGKNDWQAGTGQEAAAGNGTPPSGNASAPKEEGQNRIGGQGFNASNRGEGRNGSGMGMQNLTEEQRQQMLEERMRQMAEGCAGKSEGDACEISGPRGNETGSCSAKNGTLVCSPGNNGFGTGGFLGGGGNAPPLPQ